MWYTESFKKQVVKKALEQGVVGTELCRKLHISETSLGTWKKLYGAEMQKEVVEVDLSEILRDEVPDIDELLKTADQKDLESKTGSAELARRIDELERSGKNVAAYTAKDKYAIVRTIRMLDQTKRGIFLRQHGLDDRHITLWEEELIDMSKEPIQNNDYTKKLEEENKKLKKQVGELERDKHELEVLIELKKKYPQLFKSDEDEK